MLKRKSLSVAAAATLAFAWLYADDLVEGVAAEFSRIFQVCLLRFQLPHAKDPCDLSADHHLMDMSISMSMYVVGRHHGGADCESSTRRAGKDKLG